MTIKAATTAAAVATAATPRRRRASGFARMAAFLLVASVVLADVIRVCEYRYYDGLLYNNKNNNTNHSRVYEIHLLQCSI